MLQLVARLVAAGSTSTVLWLLPDALVPAAVSFWHALLAADRRCVHSYAARELTCVPATSDEPSSPQTGDSQQAFEPAFEPPLRSGEVSQHASEGATFAAPQLATLGRRMCKAPGLGGLGVALCVV